jgi:HEAT repeat protein
MSAESVVDLLADSLAGDREDDAAWKAVTKLHRLGTQEVLDEAIHLTRLSDPYRRAIGADILGQLGVQPGVASVSFVSERLKALLALLRDESDPLVLDAVIIALGHLREPEGIRAILPYCEHPDDNVRYAVAWALPGGSGNDSGVISTLLKLMRDADSDVRDWATFGLGTQTDVDSPLIRDSLFERLQDSDYDTRAEAAVGLAKRKDLRVLPAVLKELASEEYGVLFEEAASYLLGLDSVKLDGWESWRYVEELHARFYIVTMQPDLPVQ